MANSQIPLPIQTPTTIVRNPRSQHLIRLGRLLWAVPLYMTGRLVSYPLALPLSLTLSPSPRCNSRCQTCGIWRKREDELSLAEWERILASLGSSARWLTISGGEPFLYPDLSRLIDLCVRYCRPEVINLPSNALLTERIASTVEAAVKAYPDVRFVVNLSLDGVGDEHDRIRGVPGNFQRFNETRQLLQELQRQYSNLAVGIHTVISTLNIAHLPELFAYVRGLGPISYITEIAEERVELDTIALPITPSLADYSIAVDALTHGTCSSQLHGVAQVIQAFRLEYYHLVEEILARRCQVIPCYAGWASAHIYANGAVWPCCVRADNMGSLRQADYDFRSVWHAPQAQAIRHSIRRKECACPLANAAYTNMLCHPPTLARVAVRYLGHALRARGGGG